MSHKTTSINKIPSDADLRGCAGSPASSKHRPRDTSPSQHHHQQQYHQPHHHQHRPETSPPPRHKPQEVRRHRPEADPPFQHSTPPRETYWCHSPEASLPSPDHHITSAGLSRHSPGGQEMSQQSGNKSSAGSSPRRPSREKSPTPDFNIFPPTFSHAHGSSTDGSRTRESSGSSPTSGYKSSPESSRRQSHERSPSTDYKSAGFSRKSHHHRQRSPTPPDKTQQVKEERSPTPQDKLQHTKQERSPSHEFSTPGERSPDTSPPQSQHGAPRDSSPRPRVSHTDVGSPGAETSPAPVTSPQLKPWESLHAFRPFRALGSRGRVVLGNDLRRHPLDVTTLNKLLAKLPCVDIEDREVEQEHNHSGSVDFEDSEPTQPCCSPVTATPTPTATAKGRLKGMSAPSHDCVENAVTVAPLPGSSHQEHRFKRVLGNASSDVRNMLKTAAEALQPVARKTVNRTKTGPTLKMPPADRLASWPSNPPHFKAGEELTCTVTTPGAIGRSDYNHADCTTEDQSSPESDHFLETSHSAETLSSTVAPLQSPCSKPKMPVTGCPLLGNWKLHMSENWEAFLKEAGLGMVLRRIACDMTTFEDISVEGENWYIRMTSPLKNFENIFRLNEEFEEENFDGKRAKSVASLSEEGTVLTMEQTAMEDGGLQLTITREVTTHDQLLVTIVSASSDVIARRYFTRIG